MHQPIRFRTALLASVALAVLPGIAWADGARDWANLPIDTQVLYVYYNHVDSNTQIDTSLPVDGLHLKMNMGMVRYARSFALDGKTAGLQFLLPYTWADAHIDSSISGLQKREFSTSGAGDLTSIFAFNLFGAPALTRQQFAQAAPETLLTAALFVTAPTGKYDANDIANFGGNRWVLKPQLAFNHPFGASMIAVDANLAFYSDNDRYRQGGTIGRLKQDPLATLEAHYSYAFNRAIWAAFDAVYGDGGETKFDGIRQGNTQHNLRLGVSGSMNFSPFDAVAFSYLRTIDPPSHAPDVKLISINYNHAW